MSKLFKRHGKKGHYVAEGVLTEEDILSMARLLTSRRFRRGRAITNPKDAQQYLSMQLSHYEHEVFCCLFLDNRHRVLAFEEMFRGTIDGASVHPREVVKRALQLNAAAVILAHNHPSGVAEPSKADEHITKRLEKALALIDVRVLDHLIIGDEEVVSLAERGLL